MAVLTEIGRYSLFDIYDFIELASKKEDWRNALVKTIDRYISSSWDQKIKSFYTKLKKLIEEQTGKELIREIFSLEIEFNFELASLVDNSLGFIMDVLNRADGQYTVNYNSDIDLFLICEYS